MPSTLPITLLTGFLGSGKTTLLRHAMQSTVLEDTVVLVNELGEIGLDQQFFTPGEMTVLLENGCLCCTVRDDLIQCLEDLFWRRLHRRMAPFSRVIVETTGLADPQSIISPLRSGLVGERYRLRSVVTTVDAVLGHVQLDQYGEAIAQVESADVLVVTKGDLASTSNVASLEARLRGLNATARVLHANQGALPDEVLLGPSVSITRQEPRSDVKMLAAPKFGGQRRRTDLRAAHGPNISMVTLRLRAPVDPIRLVDGLERIADLLGERLLRAKGIVQFDMARVFVQMVGKMRVRLEEFPVLDISEENWIVFIGVDFEKVDLATLLRSHGVELS